MFPKKKDGTYYATGSYESLAVRLFKELNVDVFYVRAAITLKPVSWGFTPTSCSALPLVDFYCGINS